MNKITNMKEMKSNVLEAFSPQGETSIFSTLNFFLNER